MLLADFAENKNLVNSIGVAFVSLAAFLIWHPLSVSPYGELLSIVRKK